MLGVKEKRLLSIKGVSQLTFQDEQFLRLAFPKDSIRYARSWLYLLRASHGEKGNLGYKYRDKDFVAIIGYRNNVVYITPVSDNTQGLKLKKLCDKIFLNIKSRIIIKKYHSAPSTLKAKSKRTSQLLEDDLYPETMLQLNKLFISLKGELNPAAKRLIQKERKFEKIKDEFAIYDDITKVSKSEIIQFLSCDKFKLASYLPLIDYIYEHQNDIRYKILLFIKEKKLQGLYIGEIFSLTELGLYCALTSKNIPGITEWMDTVFFRKMLQEGFQNIYLGGSESEGIAKYILKLLPYNTSYHVYTFHYEDLFKQKKMQITIRKITESDFKPLARLYAKFYNSMTELGEHWSHELAHKFISHFYQRQPDLFFLAEYKNVIVGAIVSGTQPWWDGTHLVEGELFVDKACQNKGIEKLLLKRLFKEAREKYKAVAWDTFIPTTEKQLEWYQQVGFTTVPYLSTISGDIHSIMKRLQ